MTTSPEDPAKQEMEPGTGRAIIESDEEHTESDSSSGSDEPDVPTAAYTQVAEAPSDGQHRPMTGAEAAGLAGDAATSTTPPTNPGAS